ncbi:MAG: DUF4388 domain-containing protein [Thermoanaerobaculia bacterium]
MALEGDLRVFRLPDILQMIAQQQKTGILTVQGEQDILAVSFLRGEIVAADALNQNFEEGLGEVLASQGVVRPEDFVRVSEGHKISGQRLADYLVDRGILSRHQLLAALRQQTYRLLLQVLRWSEGEFKFYSGEEVSFEEGVQPISVEELLMRSIGDLLGEGTLSGTLPHGFVAYERLPNQRKLRLLGRDGDLPGDEPGEVWISTDDEKVLQKLDGRASATEIGESTGLGEYKTLYSLFRLLQAGLVRPRSAAVPGAAGGVDAAAETPAPVQEPAPALRRAAHADRIELPIESASASRGTLVGRILGIGCLAAAVASFFVASNHPSRLLFPYPWLRSDRATFERQERVAQAQWIDRAARTHFLLEGSYPGRLEELVEGQLLPRRALYGRSGGELGYLAEALSYTLAPQAPDGSEAALGVTETISGDFAVDPDFFRGLREEEGIPLVLLD